MGRSASGNPPEALIKVNRARRSSSAGDLLSPFSLALRAGDRCCISGPSGSGKTLLLRSLALLDPFDSGELRFRGQEVAGSRVPIYRSRVILLQQRPMLISGSVEENFRLPFTLASHRHKRFDRARVIEWLQSLGREDRFLNKSARELSGGEVQLIALLRALQLDPQVLLLDEPTAALDDEATAIYESLIRLWLEQAADTRALMWVTHDREQTERMANCKLRIERGQVTGTLCERIH